MYDMYSWDSRAKPDSTKPASAKRDSAESARAERTGAGSDPAVRAVQVALDRRDNGGDAAGKGEPDPGQPAGRRRRGRRAPAQSRK